MKPRAILLASALVAMSGSLPAHAQTRYYAYDPAVRQVERQYEQSMADIKHSQRRSCEDMRASMRVDPIMWPCY